MNDTKAETIDPTQPSTSGYNGTPLQHPQQQQEQKSNTKNIRKNAYVKITAQPAAKFKFRYEVEVAGRSAGSIKAIGSTVDKKTFPAIEVIGYKGPAVVVVSCVTKDPPYRPHPHNIVGKEGCTKGVCKQAINGETMEAVFNNLGIQCARIKDIESSLQTREDIRVDPFNTGFAHKSQASSIDLNSVRLCFQVLLEGSVKGRFTVPLTPVVSDPIFNKNNVPDVVIHRLGSCSSTVSGGKEIILLCEKVAKDNVQIRFFEEDNGHLIWEDFGEFQDTDVHKQTAITFRTPRYRTLKIEQPVKVFVQLRRPSDGESSEPLPFDYLPLESDIATLRRKRQKTGGDARIHLMRHIQAQEFQQHQQQHPQQQSNHPDSHTPSLANGMYSSAYRMPAQTPSPLPFSPSNPCNHNTGCTPFSPDQTPSPQPIPPSNLYNQNTGGTQFAYNIPAAGSIGSVNGSHMDYDAYYQQNQQHVDAMNAFYQMQSPSSQTTQQWPGTTGVKQPMPIINNLNDFNINNILTKPAPPPAATTIAQSNSNQQWNLPPESMNINNNNCINMMPNTQYNQLHYHQQTHPNHNDGAGNTMEASAAASTNEAPSISSLLCMDSDLLMHLNSEELSNLSL